MYVRDVVIRTRHKPTKRHDYIRLTLGINGHVSKAAEVQYLRTGYVIGRISDHSRGTVGINIQI